MTLGAEFDRILEAAQAGDSQALERIYTDLVPVVHGYARSMGSREPEDVTSEVFTAVLARIVTFDGNETRFRSWVMTIAHRRVVDEFRRKERRPEDPTEPSKIQVIDLADPESEAMTRLQAQGVLAAIDELTPDQRSVLLLRVVAELTAAEVAEVIGKPETAVRALQRRALMRIRKMTR